MVLYKVSPSVPLSDSFSRRGPVLCILRERNSRVDMCPREEMRLRSALRTGRRRWCWSLVLVQELMSGALSLDLQKKNRRVQFVTPHPTIHRSTSVKFHAQPPKPPKPLSASHLSALWSQGLFSGCDTKIGLSIDFRRGFWLE